MWVWGAVVERMHPWMARDRWTMQLHPLPHANRLRFDSVSLAGAAGAFYAQRGEGTVSMHSVEKGPGSSSAQHAGEPAVMPR